MMRVPWFVLSVAVVACQRPSERAYIEPAVDSSASPSIESEMDASPAHSQPETPPDAGPSSRAPHQDSLPESWFSDHGVTHWDHDRACWSKMAFDPKHIEWANECHCYQTLQLVAPDPVDILVCKRVHDGEAGFTEHTVLYSAQHGRMHVILDEPTALPSDDGLSDSKGGLAHYYVSLAVSAKGADIVLSEGTGERFLRAISCAEGQTHTEWDPTFRHACRDICTRVGRWRWIRGNLVRQH